MIDGLLANLAPSGAKIPLQGVSFVRLVEHLPLPFQMRSPIVPAQAPWQATGATSTALGTHGPARILAELPVEADGSFQARVPAGVPFRLQALDAARMTIGAVHNRWYYTLPGQVLTQGVSAATGTQRYGSRCAACHGDAAGVARPPTMETPDAITSASLTLARFERQNPRLPIDPPLLDSSTSIEVDFVRDVQPVLDARCVACHDTSSPAAGLELTGTPTTHFNRAYESLLLPGNVSGGGRALVDDGDGRARSSFLIELMTGVELDAPRALDMTGVAHPGPALGAAPLTASELLTLVRWIELGATYVGTGATP